MGSGRRAASEKCSRNQGLAHVPAMFGPDNPAQPTGFWRLSEHQLAAGNREILSPAGLSALPGTAIGRRAKPPGRPLQALPARRMVPPAHGLDQAAEQPRLQIATQACKSSPVDGRHALLVELQHVHSGLGQCAVADRSFGAATPHARRRRAAIRPQPRPFEARVDVRGIVEPRHAAREERGGELGPRYREQRPQQAHVGLLDQGRHAGQTVGTALAGSPHGHGLGLIIGVMGEQQVQDAAPAAFVAQQPVARRPRRLLQASPRLGCPPR